MAKAYKPTATDGDGDGLVQDGTPFERPAQDFIELTGGDAPIEAPEEAIEAASEPLTPAVTPDTYTATYGMTKHEYATELWRKNNGKQLNDGTTITL